MITGIFKDQRRFCCVLFYCEVLRKCVLRKWKYSCFKLEHVGFGERLLLVKSKGSHSLEKDLSLYLSIMLSDTQSLSVEIKMLVMWIGTESAQLLEGHRLQGVFTLYWTFIKLLSQFGISIAKHFLYKIVDRTTATSPIGFWGASMKLSVGDTGYHHLGSAWLCLTPS